VWWEGLRDHVRNGVTRDEGRRDAGLKGRLGWGGSGGGALTDPMTPSRRSVSRRLKSKTLSHRSMTKNITCFSTFAVNSLSFNLGSLPTRSTPPIHPTTNYGHESEKPHPCYTASRPTCSMDDPHKSQPQFRVAAKPETRRQEC